MRVWTPRPGGWLKNIFNPPVSVRNTSVMIKGGKLYALFEGGKPAEIDPMTLETLGESDLGGIQVMPRRVVIGGKALTAKRSPLIPLGIGVCGHAIGRARHETRALRVTRGFREETYSV